MKSNQIINRPFGLLCLIFLALTSCNEDDELTGVELLTISTFTPASGVPGDLVTITGTGFSEVASENKVRFNGELGSIYAAGTTELIVVVPSEASTGTISVTLDDQVTVSAEVFLVEADSES